MTRGVLWARSNATQIAGITKVTQPKRCRAGVLRPQVDTGLLSMLQQDTSAFALRLPDPALLHELVQNVEVATAQGGNPRTNKLDTGCFQA